MNSGLSKRAFEGGIFDTVQVNTYCLKTKKVVFTGSMSETARFVGVETSYLLTYLKKKLRFRKKYCFRYANKPQPQ